MADLLTWLAAFGAKYGLIVWGQLAGMLAKYGLTMKEGKPLTARVMVSDLLLQGALGVIAVVISDFAGLTGNAKVMVGALAALNADRLVRLAGETFYKRVESDLGKTVAASPSTIAEIPAGVGKPELVSVQAGAADSPVERAGAILKSAWREATTERPPADQLEALSRLDLPKDEDPRT